MKKIILFLLLTIIFSATKAQDYNQSTLDSMASVKDEKKSVSTGFLLTGYGSSSLIVQGKNNVTFGDLGFSPILLWQPSEHIFFESELEMGFDNGELNLNLEYCNINWILNKYITFRFGRFLSSFGTFNNLYHPAWINKLPIFPLGFGDGGLGPMSELGAAISGGIPLESTKINYSIYVSNGPTLDLTPGNEGGLLYENITDNNKNKAIGGRLGFMPFASSALELGASFQTAKVGDAGSIYENLNAFLYAFDFNYVKQIDLLKGTIDAKGQWNFVNVDRASYIDPSDSTKTYTYDNKRNGYYAQLSYRPTMSQNRVLKNFEIVARYAVLNLPEGAKTNAEQPQLMFGLNYWVTWRTIIKVAYQPDKDIPGFWFQVTTGL